MYLFKIKDYYIKNNILHYLTYPQKYLTLNGKFEIREKSKNIINKIIKKKYNFYNNLNFNIIVYNNDGIEIIDFELNNINDKPRLIILFE